MSLPRKSENYGDAEFLDEQWRLLDPIPRRLPVIGLLWLLAVSLAAGLVAFHLWTADITRAAARPAAFELGRGLAGWFSSLTLLVACLLALAIYSVRRYKLDDYHGRYRIWLWAALCSFLLATDRAAGLHQPLQEAMVLATGTRLLGDGSAWWVIPYFFLLGAVGSRLLLDMRECRCSCAALVAAAGCCALALAVRFGWLLEEGGPRTLMAKEGALMGGHLWLLLAMGLHARHVILDAEGLLPRRQPKPTASAAADLVEEEEEEADGRLVAGSGVSIDPPHATPPPPARPFAPTSAVQSAGASASPAPTMASSIQAAQSQVNRKLTKQEKKALRQRLLAERLKREQQKSAGWSK